MRRVAQLDGVRGLAILLVVIGHALDGIRPHFNRLIPRLTLHSGGGFVGVELFFVLSGFLITTILIREREATGAVSLRGFYARRARRLLPALGLVVAFIAIRAMLFLNGTAQREALGGAVRAALYIENMKPLVNRIPSDGWLGHTWSLAVEEQFYLVWPLVLLVACRGSRKRALIVAVVGIIATIVARELVVTLGFRRTFSPYEHLHWDALLIGCVLALRPVRLPVWVGYGGLAAIAVVTVTRPFVIPPWLYIVAAAAGAAVVATATDMPWLTWRPLRYLGTISYGFYLWHVVLLRFDLHPLVAIAVGLAVAALSFRYVERPFLRKNEEARRRAGGGRLDHHQPSGAGEEASAVGVGAGHVPQQQEEDAAIEVVRPPTDQ